MKDSTDISRRRILCSNSTSPGPPSRARPNAIGRKRSHLSETSLTDPHQASWTNIGYPRSLPMTLELIEDAKGDARNCRALAVASNLAYLPEPEGVEGFRSQLGMEARFLSVDNTQAYLATNENHIVVAFRGTESPTSLDGLKDCLLTDAANLLVLPEGDLGTDFVAAG